MPQNVPAAAIKALTDWWEGMGVEVDHTQIRAALTASTLPELAAGDRALPWDAASEPSMPTPKRRRNASRTLETWIAEASALASAAADLPALKAAIEGFDGCALKATCEQTVVYDGAPGAPVMVIGEGPGSQEDLAGLPFVGPAGQLLDRMLATIGLDRKRNVLITNVNFWRPPNNRDPEPDELAVCRPFVERMIDLARPKLILTAGGVAIKSLIDTKLGIMRLRGSEQAYVTPTGTKVPVIPMLHPAYLLQRPQDKSRAWRDLLLAQAKLKALGVEV